MNLVHLQPWVAAIESLRQMGQPFVHGVKLIPMPGGKAAQAILLVNNIYKDSWLEEFQMVDLVQRVSNMVQIPLVYGGHIIVGRDPSLFQPYVDVEILTVWLAEGSEDDLFKKPEAAQGVVSIMNGKVWLWGWLPAYVVETVGTKVKLRASRAVYGLNYNGDFWVEANYDAPWLRIVGKDREHVGQDSMARVSGNA